MSCTGAARLGGTRCGPVRLLPGGTDHERRSTAERDPSPSMAAIESAMAGNLCRCGTYTRIVAAIQSAAQNLAQIDCYEVGESAQAAGDRGGAAV